MKVGPHTGCPPWWNRTPRSFAYIESGRATKPSPHFLFSLLFLCLFFLSHSSMFFFFLFPFNFPHSLFPFNFSPCFLFLSFFCFDSYFPLLPLTLRLHHYLLLAIETVSSTCIEGVFQTVQMFHVVMIKMPLDPFQRMDLLLARGRPRE